MKTKTFEELKAAGEVPTHCIIGFTAEGRYAWSVINNKTGEDMKDYLIRATGGWESATVFKLPEVYELSLSYSELFHERFEAKQREKTKEEYETYLQLKEKFG